MLSLVGGAAQDMAIAALREGGRVAHPLGVQPEPTPRPGVELRRYDLTLESPSSTKLTMVKLNDTIASGPFSVRISKVFPLDQASAAQHALEEHRVGKIVLTTMSEA